MSALAGFITDIGTVVTAAAGWVGEVVEVIVSTPVLLVPVGMGIAFSAVALFRRLRG